MRSFEDHNPVTVVVYYLTTVTVCMFSMNPVLHLIAFLGGLIQFIMRGCDRSRRTHLFYILTGIILALVRPIFSHNGVTVLFVVNDNPITAESFIFGINSAVMVVGVLYLFRVLSEMLTSDRLLYIFGRLSPKTALVLSMGLRYIPLMKNRYNMIFRAQTAIGINKDDNVIDRMKGSLKVFDATLGWGLENGIITADSMSARYYGSGKRSCYRVFRMRRSDLVILGMVAAFMIPVVAGLWNGSFETTFYPEFAMMRPDTLAVAGYTGYACLMLIPPVLNIMENIRWKYMMSKT